MSSLSRDGFLRSGLMAESLNCMGNVPVDKDRLMMLVIVGTRRSAHSLSKEVGIWSRSHCLF